MKTIQKLHYFPALLLALIIQFLCLHGSAATFTLNPSADAFVSASQSGNNYGGAGALSIAAPGLSQGEFQSVLQFNLSGAKSSFDSQFGVGQWSISSIALQFTATPPNNAIFNASAAGQISVSWMQNDSWLEGTGTPQTPTTTGITFSTLSSFLSGADESLGTFSFNGGTSGNSSYSLGLTSLFSADVLAGNTVSIRMLAGDSAVSALFDSRSFGTVAARPVLSITAVPEPGAGAVVLLGVGILARFGRPARSRRG